MKRIGIYGGAFNPPTIGHKHVVKSMLASNLVDEIWVIPSYLHFHGKIMVPYDDRCMMCELMFNDVDERVKVVEYERDISNINSEYNGSTIDFMTNLRKLVDKDTLDFYIIIGQDNADSMETWNRGEELINQEKFFVIPRGCEAVKGMSGNEWYVKGFNRYMMQVSSLHISSTEARSECLRIAEYGASDRLKYILGHDVFAYVQHKKFYMESK